MLLVLTLRLLGDADADSVAIVQGGSNGAGANGVGVKFLMFSVECSRHALSKEDRGKHKT